jgi:hypothetical protein
MRHLESGTLGTFNEFYSERLDTVKESLVYDIGEPTLLEHFILFRRLIQSQVYFSRTSSPAGHKDSYGTITIGLLQKLSDLELR